MLNNLQGGDSTSNDFYHVIAPEETGDFISADGSPIEWKRKTLVETKEILGINNIQLQGEWSLN